MWESSYGVGDELTLEDDQVGLESGVGVLSLLNLSLETFADALGNCGAIDLGRHDCGAAKGAMRSGGRRD